MWAIIGGSGFEKFDAFKTVEVLSRETPFGEASSGMKRVQIEGKDGKSYEALFVSRHGEHHERLPTEVNYRANIFALKKHGAKAIMSFSAVGSLRKEYKPGDCVVPTSYIDRTKGLRAHTFLGDGLVGHVSLAKPVCMEAVEGLKKMASHWDFDCHFGQTYVCIEGPAFSTKAEAHYHRMIGADIIGMTHFPEYNLAREAGLAYVPCCFVTDYDCWDDSIPHVTLEEVIQVMRQNNAKAFSMAQDILATHDALYKSGKTEEQGLRTGLMTLKEMIPPAKREWLDILIS